MLGRVPYTLYATWEIDMAVAAEQGSETTLDKPHPLPDGVLAGRAGWRAEELGPAHAADVPQGTVAYHDRGTGRPLVFVHGALVNANLWRKVTGPLSRDFRCVVPDLPVGSHRLPLNSGADLSPPGLAKLIAGLIGELELEDPILIGNDTGGGLSQIVAANHPDSIGGLVLTSCDAFDNFPPKAFRPLVRLAAGVPGVLQGVMAPMRVSPIRRLPIAYGWLSKKPFDRRVADSYAMPVTASAGVRRDTRAAFAGLDPRQTLEAATRLPKFERPALIAWAREDRFFPPAHGERLAEILPNARLEWIDDSYTFVSEDQPERLVELIRDFAR